MIQQIQQGYETGEIFSYTGYEPPTVQQLDKLRESIIAHVGHIQESIVRVGDALLQARKLVKHGEWGTWLHANFLWSEKTARNYMNVAEAFKTETVSDLNKIDSSVLYMLASPRVPEAAREVALEEARNGGAVTKARAKEIIAKEIIAKEIIAEPEPELPDGAESEPSQPYGPYHPETDGGCDDSICPGGQCEGCYRAAILESRQNGLEYDRLIGIRIGMMISLLEAILAKANGLGGDTIFPEYSFSEGMIDHCWKILMDQISDL
jgi:hypothetical protein